MRADEALASSALALLPERAISSGRTRALWVADLHLGKAAAFRAQGAPVPFGASEETLRRLGALIETLSAERLVILGDFVHARASMTNGLAESIAGWRRARAALECLIVLGNHDRRTAHLYADLGFQSATEPASASDVECRHYPLNGKAFDDGPLVLSGHVHPVARLNGRGRDSLRLPCFVIEGRQIVLPAFGEFTGGRLVRAGAATRVIMAAEGRLVEAPRQ